MLARSGRRPGGGRAILLRENVPGKQERHGQSCNACSWRFRERHWLLQSAALPGKLTRLPPYSISMPMAFCSVDNRFNQLTPGRRCPAIALSGFTTQPCCKTNLKMPRAAVDCFHRGREHEMRRNAGAPGVAPTRRLSSAECNAADPRARRGPTRGLACRVSAGRSSIAPGILFGL